MSEGKTSKLRSVHVWDLFQQKKEGDTSYREEVNKEDE